MTRAGVSVAEMSARLRVSEKTVLRHRQNATTMASHHAIIRAAIAGKTTREIAALSGYKIKAVQKILRGAGVVAKIAAPKKRPWIVDGISATWADVDAEKLRFGVVYDGRRGLLAKINGFRRREGLKPFKMAEKTPRKSRPARVPVDKPRVEPVVVLRTHGLSDAYFAKPGVCHWPIGEPRTAEFRFCDATHLPGRPYCDAHENWENRV